MKELLAFVIGSSLIAGFVTLLYNSVAFRKNPTTTIKFELLPFGILALLGLANLVLYLIIEKFQIKDRFVPTIIAGIVTGLVFSLIGRFGVGLPSKLYQMKPSNHWTVHPIAMILYALIFALILYPLNEYLLY